MIVYKLTDQGMCTYGGFRWRLGRTVTVSGGKPNQCGTGWLHAYSDPLLAPLLNPIHADFQAPRLFRAETSEIGWDDRGLKLMLRDLTLLEEMDLPVFTTNQRVAFGIFCAQTLNPPDGWLV